MEAGPTGSSGASTLTVSISGGTPAGTYAFMVTGVDSNGRGPTNGAQSLVLDTETIPIYTLTATPLAPASITAGQTATSTITVSPSLGYTGTVTLACKVSGAGLGIPIQRCQLSPNTVTIGPSSVGTSTLKVLTSDSTYGLVGIATWDQN